ncbi:MAG: TetR/AcrR family transcriptional regulator [Pseudomonadota bacterium]
MTEHFQQTGLGVAKGASAQKRNRAETKTRIRFAAERVFAEYGYSGASFSMIAAEAGLPKSNIVYYYSSKKALYRVVVEDIFNVWRAAADTIHPDNDPLEALGDYIDTKLDLARTRPYGSKVWANEIIQRAPIVQDYLEGELRRWTEERIAVIDGWSAAGLIRPVSARHLLYAIWATTQHYADFTHQIRTLNDNKDLSAAQWEETKQAVKSVLLCGVAVSRGQNCSVPGT